jgi:hypothetical protein
MVRLINFLLLAIVVGGIVSWYTYKSLINTSTEVPINTNISPSITASTLPAEEIETPSQNVATLDLQTIVKGLNTHLLIGTEPEEFTIESGPSTRETVLGYKYEVNDNSEFVGDDLRKVSEYFLKNNFEVINKEDFFVSNPLSYYEEYIKSSINCFMHAYAISENANFIEVGCNSEI